MPWHQFKAGYAPVYVCVCLYVYCLQNTGNLTLKVLDFSWNNIGDDGMAVISETVLKSKSLTTLEVVQCGFSVKGQLCTVHVCIQ